MTTQIKQLLEHFIPKEHLWKIKLFMNWDAIMGPLKDKVTIEEIKEGTLLLGVIHPAWAQELFLLSPTLKRKINTCLEQERIKVIRFIFIDKAKRNIQPKTLYFDKKIADKQTKLVTLTQQERQKLQNIKDPELKTSLEQFYAKCKK